MNEAVERFRAMVADKDHYYIPTPSGRIVAPMSMKYKDAVEIMAYIEKLERMSTHLKTWTLTYPHIKFVEEKDNV